MNCPHCETPIDEHEKADCFDAWVHEVVMGKPVEWIDDQEEEFPLISMSDGSEEISTYTIPGHFFDHSDKAIYLHSSDGFTGMIPKYSWWIGHAWMIVEKMKDETFDLDYDLEDWRVFIRDSLGISPSPTIAICRAAIKASLTE